MKCMAIIKHISVKGSNGGDALDYVLFKHNETTGEKILDGQGNPIMRDEFYLAGINCEPYSFAAECAEVNALYGKNQKQDDIKAHHFIVSYDPTDATERGLTGPRAQELSMEFANRCFPGFQILVCTHMDGSNESGNIHTHLMMNSVRKYDIGPESYGERDIDHKAGYKLHLTDDYLRYMKQELMKICEREGLYQVDLLSPTKNRITDREYRVHQHGQNSLDNLNERFKQNGLEPTKTIFQTQKQYIRDAVFDVASRATSFDAFCVMMKEDYDIMVKESRGRISYLHPDREKYITGRTLGTIYEKEPVIHIINGEMEGKVSGRNKIIDEASFSLDTMEDCKKVFEMNTNLRLVVNLQTSVKTRIGASYANNITLDNVRTMAETILFVQKNGFNSLEQIEEEKEKIGKEYREVSKHLLTAKERQKDTNEIIHFMGQYLVNKNKYQEYIKSSRKKEIIAEHKNELDLYNEAFNYLETRYSENAFPKLQELKQEKCNTAGEINELYERRNMIKKKKTQIEVVLKNIKKIIGDREASLSTAQKKHITRDDGVKTESRRTKRQQMELK